MTYLLIVEKPSAAKNFAKALGGMTGNRNGQAFKIQALVGHMLSYVEPHEMVPEDMSEQFKSWDIATMPWDATKLSWQKRPQVTKNMRTGKMQSKKKDIDAVAEAAKGCSALVIATDDDPSGEGQLIGWEVIQAIGWKGPVKRMYFTDESEKQLQKGFDAITDLPSYNQDGEYLKADVRSRWDFLSMQLTRLATSMTRSHGYNVNVVRQGRLKSVMTKLVADQLLRVKQYKRVPYYEVKYKDDKGNVFTRKYTDGDTWRHASEAEAKADMQAYATGTVVVDSTTRKESAPGKLLDLGGLASILGSNGFKSKEVLQTYQKMYEAKIVSYPRTEDKVISKEQFNEMLPHVDNIARVVGADVSLLTHRAPRNTHVKDGGAHGANRPGVNVPTSLDSLSQYGAPAKAIYELLARNFLAMFGENYVFDAIKGHIKEHPTFTASVSVPVSLGFKAIFDTDSASKDDEDETEKTSKGLGTTANALVAEGVNTKPPHPSHKWLEAQLGKYDVGTGATRTNTFAEVTSGKAALLTDTRGKLNLTPTGEIAAALLEGSRIGDPGVTETLFKSMKEVGALKLSPAVVLATANELVKHDKEVFFRNAHRLKETVGEPTGDMKGYEKKATATGVHKPTGQTVTFNREWSKYQFTEEDITRLLNGETIGFTATTKTGKLMPVEGALGEGEYKGKKFWGFQRKEAEDYTRETAPFPVSWSGHTFTDAEKSALRTGKKIPIQAISAKTGNPFNTQVTFELREYKGRKSWGIEPHFEDAKPEDFTRANCSFKAEFGGYTLTPDEVKQVRAGAKVMIKATSKKTKKKYSCNVSLEINEYEGRRFWGLKPHFE